jgi:RNA 2',3'-cyclic 3'-phosphodiesterase
MAETGDTGRYFLAAWPDDAIRDRLVRWADAIQAGTAARRVPADNLHITLVFLGTLDPPRLDAVKGVAADAPWSGALLTLDRIGYWKRARIIWAGTSEGSEALSALTATLRGRLGRLGFRVDTRPFVPHVTLYRKAARRPRWRPEVIDWRIERFCLVRSTLSASGARYEIVERW